MITLPNHELILRKMAIMRSQLENQRKIFSSPPGFEPWPPGTNVLPMSYTNPITLILHHCSLVVYVTFHNRKNVFFAQSSKQSQLYCSMEVNYFKKEKELNNNLRCSVTGPDLLICSSVAVWMGPELLIVQVFPNQGSESKKSP